MDTLGIQQERLEQQAQHLYREIVVESEIFDNGLEPVPWERLDDEERAVFRRCVASLLKVTSST